MGTANQLDDAITVIHAAFADDASEATMSAGIQMLDTMRSSLQGAISAQAHAHAAPQPQPATAPQPEAPPAAEEARTPPKSAVPDLLDYVIGVLTSQLDEDDRKAVDLSSGDIGFSVPFIRPQQV